MSTMSDTAPQTILVKRLPNGEGLPVPRRMTEGSSGSDVCAALEEPLELLPGARALIPTGFCFEIPAGYEIQVRPRSGLAAKHGVTVLNAPGTVDSDYRGEVKVILVNLSPQPFIIRHGDRIAQLVPMQVASHCLFSERKTIADSERGSGGFGHTGV